MFGKIFGACALGAAVGTALALELAPYLWWVGMLVGGLVGYFTYEFREVRSAAKTAWKKTVAWRPFWPWWRVLGQTLAGCFIAPTLFVGSFYLGQQAFLDPANQRMTFSVIMWLTVGIGACLFFLFGAGSESFWSLRLAKRFGNSELATETVRSNLRGWAIGIAVVALISLLTFFSHLKIVEMIFMIASLSIGGLLLLTLVIGFALNIAIGVWQIRMVPFQLAWTFFRLIHSDIRLLCAVDAALGTAAGYAAGSALVGALAGGTFGVLNYYLVSVRWLKLAPAGAHKKS